MNIKDSKIFSCNLPHFDEMIKKNFLRNDHEKQDFKMSEAHSG